jgi:predicted nucleic acid-binding protein
MREMVDTQVLCYAVADPAGAGAGTPLAEMCLASKVRLARMDVVRISAVVWFEICRMPAMRAALAPFESRFFVDPFDGRVAEVAAALVEKCRNAENRCPECWAAKDAQPCKRCGANLSRQQRINDALIVATASEARDVETLYSFDGGVLSFAEHVTGVEVKRPPSPHGDLFENLMGGRASVIPIQGGKGSKK